MKMLDYVVMAGSRLRENLSSGEELVAPLVNAFVASGCDSIRLVASGSSRNSADCAKHYMQESMGAQVVVVTPEAFVRHESVWPSEAFNVIISQSGYSTNVLAALDFARERRLPCVALTGNPESPLCEHAAVILDFGVGVESVDFVTMGVQALVEYLLLFSTYAALAMGRLTDEALASRLFDLATIVDVHSKVLEVAASFVEGERLQLSRMSPAMIVGDGPNFGVAEEAALKFSETLKLPTMYFEGEEFIHGPEMQITPGYLVFVIDDPEGSPRLARTARLLRTVTESTYLLTSHPRGEVCEIVMPTVPRALLAAIPNLAFFQYVAAQKAEELRRWDVHPYLDTIGDEMEAKAEGYDRAMKALEARAIERYGDPAES